MAADLLKLEIKVDLRNYDRFRKQIASQLRSGKGHVRAAHTKWGVRYRSFMQSRFVKFSRGGGDWPALSPSTRRRRGEESEAAILRDTNTLFGSLTPVFLNLPGQVQKNIPFGIEVGIGGPAGHPNSPATVADIALWHHTGAGNLPKRTIIVFPPPTVINQMRSDLNLAINRIIRDNRLKTAKR